MDTCGLILTWLIYSISTCSFCQGVLRQKCQVLEKKYFSKFLDLKFNECPAFEELDFTIGVNCDMVEHLNMSLKEVPLETDWLCLTKYKGITIKSESFSQFTSLKSLYITGNFELLPGSFIGLSQLSTLWIESEYMVDNITFHEETFSGLNALQELKISGVSFSTLNLSIFNNLHLLEHLILESNKITSLSTVTPLLGKLNKLHKLSVISNLIEELREADCVTLQYPTNNEMFVDFNISYLDLSKNILSTIEKNSLCNFPHLELFKVSRSGIDADNIYLSGIKTCKTFLFSYNSFGSFNVCKYTSHFKVKELLIINSAINDINTFTVSCKKLKKLDLSYSYLDKVSLHQMQRLNGLIELNVSYNEIESFQICVNESMPIMKLVNLNVSFNYLSSLQKGQFACLKNLQILSLENNKINHIEDFAFDGLTQLQVLNLQYNNIFIIGEYTFNNLFSLRHLNLYKNTIHKFHSQAFLPLVYLEDIQVTYDDMNDLFWWYYIRSSIKHIALKTTNLQLLSESLQMYPWLESLELDSRDIFMSCSEFVVRQVKELRLTNIFTFHCLDIGVNPLANFTNLEKFYYTANSQEFSDITLNNSLNYLSMLNFLHLEDTDKLIKAGQINVHDLFSGLPQLKVLHLKNSGIDHLDSEVIFSDLEELEFLVIENQNIEEIKENVFSVMPNLKYIYFLQITFPCNCKFTGLLSWLESGTPVSIINYHNQECHINKVTINMISFLHSNCRTDLDLIMFLSTFVCTLLFMCMSLFYESIWWYILYMFYTIKCWLNHRQRDRDHYEYDVFVSYNTRNERWVTEQLLPNLEQNGPPYFKVCIHNRDFEIGRDIVENIVDSIYKSRWTICVITRSYLQSNWCSLEMRMATYRLVAESKDSLIMIFLDKISRAELQHYHKLTKLLDKKTYLNWPDDGNGQQLFWARLRKVIGKSGRENK